MPDLLTNNPLKRSHLIISANGRQATFTRWVRRDRKHLLTIQFTNAQPNPTLKL
ncbi:hypothetical protein [Nostoc sp. LPT]|uniref:hypothetical protein n=1 Tax=Nostoc sp. LPT TaxID=2815387 RepID=UPI001DA14EFB|nr:hypothetical protein [Nostoc sp. LPT]MBN4002222.1 hypothetical protein [Nostoc sp. LPT]